MGKTTKTIEDDCLLGQERLSEICCHIMAMRVMQVMLEILGDNTWATDKIAIYET
eukprot:m.175013 g.175013  ORF g.175013 m.175013 type:complete len:55 (+) comp14886_c0_seq3:2330-2494(+)